MNVISNIFSTFYLNLKTLDFVSTYFLLYSEVIIFYVIAVNEYGSPNYFPSCVWFLLNELS